jgi:transglutaminase-like putative cysteine protease
VRVALGTFARSGIEARLGSDLAAGVQAALLHYTRRLGSGRTPPELPRFRRGSALEASGADFDLPVDPEIQRILEREVRRQKAPAEQLAAHAVFVYLADLDRAR